VLLHKEGVSLNQIKRSYSKNDADEEEEDMDEYEDDGFVVRDEVRHAVCCGDGLPLRCWCGRWMMLPHGAGGNDREARHACATRSTPADRTAAWT
jgi:hypothetical protein